MLTIINRLCKYLLVCAREHRVLPSVGGCTGRVGDTPPVWLNHSRRFRRFILKFMTFSFSQRDMNFTYLRFRFLNRNPKFFKWNLGDERLPVSYPSLTFVLIAWYLNYVYLRVSRSRSILSSGCGYLGCGSSSPPVLFQCRLVQSVTYNK